MQRLKDLKPGQRFGLLYGSGARGVIFAHVNRRLKSGLLSCEVINGQWDMHLNPSTGAAIVALYPDMVWQSTHAYVPPSGERLPPEYNAACEVIRARATPLVP